jgi:hypothetical protein
MRAIAAERVLGSLKDFAGVDTFVLLSCRRPATALGMMESGNVRPMDPRMHRGLGSGTTCEVNAGRAPSAAFRSALEFVYEHTCYW